jgi:hypothetical protein
MFQYREGHWRILEFSSRQPLTGLHGTGKISSKIGNRRFSGVIFSAL